MVRPSRQLLRNKSYGYLHLLFQTGSSGLDYVLLTTGTLAAVAAGLPFPLLGVLFGQLVDDLNSNNCNASQQRNDIELQSKIRTKVLLMICIAVANFIAIYIHASCWSLFGERLIGRLRRQYFKSLLRQEMAFFDSLPAGEVTTRLTADMETIRTGTSEKVGVFIASFAYFIGAYVVAFLKAPTIAAMVIFMFPAYVLIVLVGGRYIGRYTASTSHHLAAAASVVAQSLSNVALIHCLGANQRIESKLVMTLGQAQRAALQKSAAAATQFGFVFLVAYSANALAFWQGSKEIANAAEGGTSEVTAGSVYTVIFVLLDASFVISQVAPFLQIFSAATAAAQMLVSIVERIPAIDGSPMVTTDSLLPLSGTITFEDVAFAYPSRPEVQVLKGVSLQMAIGKSTAIVGVSGSGKSTLGALSIRLYDPCAGRILLDGRNIADMNARNLRQSVVVVDQDPELLCCSILENIAFGIINADDRDLRHCPVGTKFSEFAKHLRKGQDLHGVLSKEPPDVKALFEQVQQAAISADAHSFIENLRHGYATLVGPAEVEMSGGQKQRLALARALVKDPPILLLDEATSSLDSASEQKILASLRESRRGKTTVTIAHRLSTVKNADHIIVMHDGQVVEQGTHDELIAKEGTYTSMTEAQSLQVPTQVSAQPSEVSTAVSSQVSETQAAKLALKLGSSKSFRRFSFSKDSRIDRETTNRSRYKSIKGFASLARPQLLFLVIGMLGAIVAGGAYSGDAVIFGTTIGHLHICQGASRVRLTGDLAGLLFFTLALLAFFANSIGGSAFGRVAEKIVLQVRILTFRSLFQQDVLWHTSNGRTPALLLSYFTTDTAALADLSGVVVGTILTILVNLVASIIMTHIIAWKIAIVLLATLPVLLGSGFMRLYALAKLQARHQKLYAASADISLEAVASIKTIASYSLEQEFYERYSQSLQAPHKALIRDLACTNFWLATAYSVSLLIYALAYWWGSKQIEAGAYSQTQFFIVLPALLFSAQSCGQMFALAPDVSNARLAAARLFDLISSTPESISGLHPGPIDITSNYASPELDPEKALPLAPTPHPTPPESPGMAISLTNIRFAYPHRPSTPVLHDLNLSIESGQFIGLVGPSGAGKSTILSLLLSLYTSTSGSISIDKAPISSSHRSQISYVPQQSALFADNIAFNISLGAHPSHNPTPLEIREACQQANIDALIDSLPNGYETHCGSGSTHFSGGQKARLCIARALVRKPRLLLLDEPTSALDAEAEKHLSETIERLRGRMTIVVVAHRLCSVQRADRICWIEGGEVRDSGTHQELLARCAAYRESAICQSLR